MIDDEQRPRYWLRTAVLAGAISALAIACALVVPLFAAPLNASSFLGFPLGFYLAAQGIQIVLIVAVYWAASRQAAIDRKYGATEDL